MAVPSSVEARIFYRCVFQRHEDALVLLTADRTTGAVYLRGFGIECIFKALVLSALAPAARTDMLGLFRGVRGHNYEWLRSQYLNNAGTRFPRQITEAFTLVNGWSTDLRYLPRTLKRREAQIFLAAGAEFIH